jgi:hypothetical protein
LAWRKAHCALWLNTHIANTSVLFALKYSTEKEGERKTALYILTSEGKKSGLFTVELAFKIS